MHIKQAICNILYLIRYCMYVYNVMYVLYAFYAPWYQPITSSLIVKIDCYQRRDIIPSLHLFYC